ncbi:MAG TPA: c-type cytochrome [Usitatibacter sp.]|nr:c-type cytochrome [Usitatibacter sp.]
MAEPHHHDDPIEENIDTHPVKVAIGVAIGAAALIIGIMMLAAFAVGSYGQRSMADEPAMSKEAVAKRLAPVAKFELDPNAPPASAPPAAPAGTVVAATAAAMPAPAKGGAADGKKTYETVCFACHGAGVAGAPKFGDKAAWAPRVAQGKDTLHASALKGKGAMPAKGGNTTLSDADVTAAVDYMVAAAK